MSVMLKTLGTPYLAVVTADPYGPEWDRTLASSARVRPGRGGAQTVVRGSRPLRLAAASATRER
ncbi:hypothetical protein GCM10023220_16600 [Streptomyces ziwulingensis]|uniref:Uncharacterized protein n=1 Tax=Streptomyces ziwulingensis TaxID=1045501 RepID=A0ABP9B7T2_9ACTN